MLNKRKFNFFIIILILSLVIFGGSSNLRAQTQNQLKSAEAQGINNFQQAPMLQKMVNDGDIPPLNERLPEDPVVVKTVNEIGEYGGTWNRAHSGEGMGQWYQTNYYEPFVRWTRDAEGILFNLVKNWEWNKEKTKVTIHFVEGIKWSDGEKLTVDDFLFWWEDMVLDERLPMTPPKGTHIEGEPMKIQKVDNYTLSFTFAKSNPIFMQHMNQGPWSSAYYMVPSHYLKQFHPKYNDELGDEETDQLIDHYENRHQYPDMPTFTAWKTVKFESGKRAVFERNPYYWKVDTEGNQLPYIDKIVSRRIQDPEMQVVKTLEGDIDAQFRGYSLKDMFLLSEKGEDEDFKIIQWNRGEFAWPWLMLAYNNPDNEIRDLMYNKNFRRALSFSIDREEINDVVFMGLGKTCQMALNPKVPLFNSEEGQKLIQEWQNSYTDFKPEKAKELLDEVGMVDENEDGFRERPDGDKLNIIVDVISSDTESIEALEIIKKNWESVGIKTTINTVSGNAATNRRLAEEYMVSAWGSAAAWWPLFDPFIWTPTTHLPQTIAQQSGLYYSSDGEEGEPPREGSVLEELQKLYTKASVTADDEKRKEILFEAFRLHIEEGPITIGTVGYTTSPVIVKNNFKNVPEFGYIGHWHIGYPGTANPEQFFISE